jgi:hypothetical protein
MAAANKHKQLRGLIAISLLAGVALGTIGAMLPAGKAQYLFWAFSSFSFVIGATLLGSKLTREDHDIPAAGFIALGIGNAMIYGFIATHDVGTGQFGAGIMIYGPGMLLISLYDRAHPVQRVIGYIAAAAFTTLAAMIYLGADVTKAQAWLQPLAYNTMSIVLVWWAVLLLRGKA